MRTLNFSEDYLSVDVTEDSEDAVVFDQGILLNVGQSPMNVVEGKLESRRSSIFRNVNAVNAQVAAVIRSEYGFDALSPYPKREELMKKWQHVHQIFPLPHLEHTNLWRSEKERIGNISYNLWFASAGTDCGIHNEHPFLEVHTQVWGTGHMQKFTDEDESTMYQDIFMTPGYTHEPFCGENDHIYPHHRYYADTDCIWLAVEYYNS